MRSGFRRALAAAVHTKGAGRRHTALAHRLKPHPNLAIVTMRYDRARQNLDRHPNYILAAYMASGT